MKKSNVIILFISAFIFLFFISIGYGVFATIKYMQLNAKFNNLQSMKVLNFDNANSRETYFTMHNIKKAHQLSTGKGIKVGIIDSNFGCNIHDSLYKGKKDFTNNCTALNEVDEHGYYMAKVLKEIAPDVEIYALNAISFTQTEAEKTASVIAAIDWTIDNNMDVLTYSSSRFTGENEKLVNAAIDRATENGIVTAFIHCPNKNNLLPTYMTMKDKKYDGRAADLNIISCDYGTLFLDRYFEVQKQKSLTPNQRDDILFGSASSTSPVTAGFVALLKSVNNSLNPKEYKKILIDTSRKEIYNGIEIPKVPDIYKAIIALETYK